MSNKEIVLLVLPKEAIEANLLLLEKLHALLPKPFELVISDWEKIHGNQKIFSKKNFRRKKIEICKSSETRVAEVSWRSERSSRGKRTFEVRRRLGGTRGA